MNPDPIIDRSPAQKRLRIEIMRLELKQFGYSIVKTAFLSKTLKRLPPAEYVEAMIEAAR